MYKTLALLFMLSLFIWPVHLQAKQITAEEIIEALPKIDNISCDFAQEKFISNSGVKIFSNGIFQFDKKEGVIFETTYPIKNTISYKINSNQRVNRIITAISNKNFSVLEKNFDIWGDKTSASWQLKLIPKKEYQVAQVLEYILIIGNKYVEEIRIYNLNADYTILKFSCPKE